MQDETKNVYELGKLKECGEAVTRTVSRLRAEWNASSNILI